MSPAHAELRVLLHALSDGPLNALQAERLNSLLHGDPEACELYLNHLTLEAHLVREFGGSATAAFLPSSFPIVLPAAKRRFSPFWRYALAAGIAVCATILILNELRPSMAGRTGANQDAVATLLFTQGCEWDHPSSLREGERLRPGWLHLRSGLALLRFDGGAELVLRGDSKLELRTQGKVRLECGTLLVRASGLAAGFLVSTPTHDLTDLGTEFAVAVEHSGATELHVLEGAVAYQPASGSNLPASVLPAGHAMRFADSAPVREVPLTSERFEQIVQAAQPQSRADLMSAYEGFLYPPGTLPLAESNQGLGWRGPWRLRKNSEKIRPDLENVPAELKIVHGQMNVTWPVPGGRFGMLEIPPVASFLVRELAQPIDLKADTINYFSLMVRELDSSEGWKAEPASEAVRLTFRSSLNYFGECVSFGLGGNRRPQVECGRGISFNSPLLAPGDQTTLWIGKIVSRQQGEDEISFRIYGENDVLDYAEPAVWHVVSRNLDLKARLNLVLLSSTGKSSRLVDELRIGPTWRSVAPMKVLP